MWLTAWDRSAAVQPMSRVLEESPFKDQIVRALDLSGDAQLILRVGHVTDYPAPVSLRMPVSS